MALANQPGEEKPKPGTDMNSSWCVVDAAGEGNPKAKDGASETTRGISTIPAAAGHVAVREEEMKRDNEGDPAVVGLSQDIEALDLGEKEAERTGPKLRAVGIMG